MDWFDFGWLTSPEAWAALAALTAMEIVLGVDNIVFISILTSKLPLEQQPQARRLGLVSRLALLFCIKWIMGLEAEFYVFGEPDAAVAATEHTFRWGVSYKGLILVGGGLFLLYKATTELWSRLEGPKHGAAGASSAHTFAVILFQIAVLDMVFSLDSVITAVGMAESLMVMAIAMIAAVIVMLVFVNKISDFIDQHPSMKILALSFLMLIGVMLTAEGTGQHMPKGYIYAAMAFSIFVELLNMRFRTKHTPVQLRGEPAPAQPEAVPS
jgi:predicted tellurium resistance membrane protein TerC